MAQADENLTEKLEDEDEATRHRRQRRELQATIQQMKKSVNKNDKAKKKKIDAEIRALEEAFEKKWAHFDENATTSATPIIDNATTENADISAVESDQKQHVSRKARRLANKEKRYAEAHADDENIDYDNQPDAIRRREESSRIEEQLANRGLQIRSIPSDGNCMFASIVDQVSEQNIRKLREIVANYLRQHRKEYEPFIESDYETYCSKMAKENVWGGQLELLICAKVLQRPIEIVQGNGEDAITIDCPTPIGPPIVLTYHRYLYTNGEHYNSTSRACEDDDD